MAHARVGDDSAPAILWKRWRPATSSAVNILDPERFHHPPPSAAPDSPRRRQPALQPAFLQDVVVVFAVPARMRTAAPVRRFDIIVNTWKRTREMKCGLVVHVSLPSPAHGRLEIGRGLGCGHTPESRAHPRRQSSSGSKSRERAVVKSEVAA